MKKSLLSKIGANGAGLMAIGFIATGIYTVETRYARATDVQQQIQGVQGLFLQSERRALMREKFDLEVARSKRSLTPLEDTRLRQVIEELRLLEGQMQQQGR